MSRTRAWAIGLILVARIDERWCLGELALPRYHDVQNRMGLGAEEDMARTIFDRYIEAGDNFLDTADGYTSGKSEEMPGKLVSERALCERAVIATKLTMNTDPGKLTQLDDYLIARASTSGTRLKCTGLSPMRNCSIGRSKANRAKA